MAYLHPDTIDAVSRAVTRRRRPPAPSPGLIVNLAARIAQKDQADRLRHALFGPPSTPASVAVTKGAGL